MTDLLAADLTVILSIVFALVLITNLIVQVLKSLTWDKIPTNLLAFVVSLVCSFVAMFLYCHFKALQVSWVAVVLAVLLSFAVCYSAMFGFDKFKELVTEWQKINKSTKE